ncbi:MAG: DUF2520 domain-containing protein [Syntrophomonadaceae bacterium]|nr:DUF2520 domain-containing protein [Syntrophomonadaceae bacterium]
MKKRIGIIGAGVVGTAVGVVLKQKGYEITGVYDINIESTENLGKKIRCSVHTSPQSVSHSADILFITTSDSAIQEVVNALADRKAFYAGQVVLHMSGAQTSQILERAKEFGARVLSLHPIQAFADPEQAIQNLPGSVFSIEGDKDAYDIAVSLVEDFKGEYFFIDKGAKPVYHAGACVVSNYLVTLVDFGVKLLESTGIPKSMAINALMPLISGTVRNIEKIGIPGALTGPIARGDIPIVKDHLQSLEKMVPELLELYSLLGFHTARIAREKGTIDDYRTEEFQDMFLEQLAASSITG